MKEESKTELEPKVPSGMRWNMHALKAQILPTGGPWTWHRVFQKPMLKGKPDKLGVVLCLEVRTDWNFFQKPHKEAPCLDFQDCSLCQHWWQVLVWHKSPIQGNVGRQAPAPRSPSEWGAEPGSAPRNATCFALTLPQCSFALSPSSGCEILGGGR